MTAQDFQTQTNSDYVAFLYQQMKQIEAIYVADPTNALKMNRYTAAKLRYQEAKAK